MEEKTIDLFLSQNAKYFRENVKDTVIKDLEKADEGLKYSLFSLHFRSPLIVLLISLFAGAFGVDRFIIGHKWKGIFKMSFMVWFILYIYFAIFFYERKLAGALPNNFVFIGFVGSSVMLLIASLWVIIDFFLIYGATYEYNYKKFKDFIARTKSGGVSKSSLNKITNPRKKTKE